MFDTECMTQAANCALGQNYLDNVDKVAAVVQAVVEVVAAVNDLAEKIGPDVRIYGGYGHVMLTSRGSLY